MSVNETKLPQDAVLDRLIEADQRLKHAAHLFKDDLSTGLEGEAPYSLLSAVNWYDDGQAAANYLRRALPEKWQDSICEHDDDVIDWFNDDEATSYKDIKAVIQRAIELRQADLDAAGAKLKEKFAAICRDQYHALRNVYVEQKD